MNNQTAIRLKQVTKFYGKRPGVVDLSAEIPRGSLVGLLGPNGAGKSTTLRILACCIPPSSGEAEVCGFDVFQQSVEARRHLGYLPENCPLYPEMRVLEYLQWTAAMKGMETYQIDKSAYDVMRSCGIEHVRSQLIGTLSKGYRQRVGLASVLIHKPDVLILDEPTVGLDPLQVREFRSLIGALKGEHTVLISSHILSEVEMLCDEVIILNDGWVVASGKPSDLRQHVPVQYIVECRNHPSLTALLPRLLETFHQTELLNYQGKGDFVRFVLLTDEDNPLVEVYRFFAEAKIDLRELKQQHITLEDVFVYYTSHKQGVTETVSASEPDRGAESS